MKSGTEGKGQTKGGVRRRGGEGVPYKEEIYTRRNKQTKNGGGESVRHQRSGEGRSLSFRFVCGKQYGWSRVALRPFPRQANGVYCKKKIYTLASLRRPSHSLRFVHRNADSQQYLVIFLLICAAVPQILRLRVLPSTRPALSFVLCAVHMI